MDIIIKPNKKRFPYLLFISLPVMIAFIIISLRFEFKDVDINQIYFFVCSVGMVLWSAYFSILSLADYLKVQFDKEAVLTISDEGFEDRSGVLSCGKIPWSQVTNVAVKRKYRVDLLFVWVTDPALILTGQPGWKRFLLNKISKKTGTPVVFAGPKMNCDIQELKSVLEERVGLWYSTLGNNRN